RIVERLALTVERDHPDELTEVRREVVAKEVWYHDLGEHQRMKRPEVVGPHQPAHRLPTGGRERHELNRGEQNPGRQPEGRYDQRPARRPAAIEGKDERRTNRQ